MKLTQRSKNGVVTLTCSRGDFALLLYDAAKSMTGRCEPLRADVIRLAGEFSQHEAKHNGNSGAVYLLRDVKRALGEPLLSDEQEGKPLIEIL